MKYEGSRSFIRRGVGKRVYSSARAADGSVVGIQTHGGEIVEDAAYVYSVSIADEMMTINPAPIIELEYLKDFIDGIPNDCFVESERATHLKIALFNKVDEVALKVENNDYVGSLNKLLFDIGTKVDGDTTARDWVIDLEAQSDLCAIIDHIIFNIEELLQT